MRTHLSLQAIYSGLTVGMSVKRLAFGLLALVTVISWGQQAEADHPVRRYEQRPDLWSWPVYNAWVPYRKEMNRPRFVGGYIVSKIEPTSQEAMSWREHHAEGAYRDHRPGYVKTYYYPKPWEVLPIDPRPATPPTAETTEEAK